MNILSVENCNLPTVNNFVIYLLYLIFIYISFFYVYNFKDFNCTPTKKRITTIRFISLILLFMEKAKKLTPCY